MISVIAIAGGAAAAAPVGTVLCHMHDHRIDEASGIARGIRSPDVLYVQNDSGDTNRFFALDARTCRTRAVLTVPGARNVDWEDIAVAPDSAGTPSVWLADIGDNDDQRAEVDVYRMAEPKIGPGSDQSIRTAAAAVYRFRYPNGAANAESFAVTPDGIGYVVTKSVLGRSSVYRLPATPDPARVRTATPIGTISFAPDLSAGGDLGVVGSVLATSAAFSRDGTVFVVRTYTAAYVWAVSGGDLAAALTGSPTRTALPEERQGEGVAIDGDRLLLDSEGVDGPVYSIPLVAPPAAARATASAAAPARSVTAGATPTSSVATSSSTSRSGGGSGGSWWPGIVILVLLVGGSLGWWVLQARGGRAAGR